MSKLWWRKKSSLKRKNKIQDWYLISKNCIYVLLPNASMHRWQNSVTKWQAKQPAKHSYKNVIQIDEILLVPKKFSKISHYSYKNVISAKPPLSICKTKIIFAPNTPYKYSYKNIIWESLHIYKTKVFLQRKLLQKYSHKNVNPTLSIYKTKLFSPKADRKIFIRECTLGQTAP